jgi:hypothetical protein
MSATQVIGSSWNRRIATITTLTLIVFVGVIADIAVTSTSISPSNAVTVPKTTGTQPPAYPIGVTDKAEASGVGIPGPGSFSGFKMVYSTNFPGNKVPAGWIVYHGVPMSDWRALSMRQAASVWRILCAFAYHGWRGDRGAVALPPIERVAPRTRLQ